MTPRCIRPICSLLAAAMLAACGGGGGGNDTMGGSKGPPPRGTLLQNVPQLLSTVTTSTLLVELNAAAANQQVLALSGPPACDILLYHIEYETVGGAEEPTSASAALLVPTGGGSSCTGDRPIVLYAHGTSTERSFNMADMQNSETLLLAAIFAAQGYIVVAPNYAGYDTSSLPYHPYLVADQQSKDMIDALTAARTALPLASATLTRDDGRLYVTGYSQGGFVALATVKAMQAAGMQVKAAVPMSGPYALTAFSDAVFYGEVNGGGPVSTTFLLTAYQHAYQNVYSNPGDVFEPQYAAGIDTLLPSSETRGQLYAAGKLPQFTLFSSTPPAPQFASITPPTQPAALAPVFALGFGAGDLITNSYRLSYLEDAQAHPDGGFPTLTDAAPPSSPQLPLREDLVRNDLRSFVPSVPLLLCGGALDPVVFWLNTQLMQAYWARQAPGGVPVTYLDLEATPSAPYASLQQGFTVAKAAVAADAVAHGATDGGQQAVFEAYHVQLVAPFCVTAARDFIQAH
ncbi:MAG: prolyl oligopeptidase family serine peptidase [Gammaproteobacteria bacterium]|nr:prolyl oligopeptidase family serine peptidase [Gammaproteobacteria bacterium]